MNPLDILIIVFLAFGVGWGVFRGLIRSVICLLSLYVVALVSIGVYTTVAGWTEYLMTSITTTTRRQSEAISFLVMVVVLTVIVNVLTKRYFPETRLSGKVLLDRFLGLILGPVLAALWVTLLTPPVEYLLGLPGAPNITLHFFQSSVLMEWVYQAVPYVMIALRPWASAAWRPEMFALH